MKLTALSLYVAVAMAALSTASFPVQAQNLERQIVGTWFWMVPESGCKIARTFRADGTALKVSGKKTTETSYIVKVDRADGARMLIETVRNDDGGRDCDEESGSTVGKRYINFVGEISATELKLCFDAGLSFCPGRYRRQ